MIVMKTVTNIPSDGVRSKGSNREKAFVRGNGDFATDTQNLI